MGRCPKPCLDPSWKKGLRTPRTFTEKGIPPTEVPNRLYGTLVGGMPFSVKFFGFLNLSSKKGLGGVWGGVPRSYTIKNRTPAREAGVSAAGAGARVFLAERRETGVW